MKKIIFLIPLFFCFVSVQALDVLPLPCEYEQPLYGTFELDATTRIVCRDAALKPMAWYFCAQIMHATGFDLMRNHRGRKRIELQIDPAIGENKALYWINVQPQRVLVKGTSVCAVYYGLQTLLQLFSAEILSQQRMRGMIWNLPCIAIQDEPIFERRGVVVDLPDSLWLRQWRNIMDAAAFCKLNCMYLSNSQTVTKEMRRIATARFITLIADTTVAVPHLRGETLWLSLLQAAEGQWTPSALTDSADLQHRIDRLMQRMRVAGLEE